MSGNQNKNSVTGPKRSTEEIKRQRSTSSSSSSKKCKLTVTSQATDQLSSAYSLTKDSYLASTQRWSKRLLNNIARHGPLARSQIIYKVNVTQLLNGLDDYTRNPAKWSLYKKKHFYCKIISFTVSWMKQLLKENTYEKVSLNKEYTCDSINDQCYILTRFYHILSTVMKFSASQRIVINYKVKELNDLKSQLAKKGQFLSSQSSLTTHSNNNDLELGEQSRQQSDECREKPTKTQESLKEVNLKSNESTLETELSKNKNHEQNEAELQAEPCSDELKTPQNSLRGKLKSHVILRVDRQVILDVCLQEKEKQLNELKKQLDSAAKKQKETEEELKKQLDSAAKKQKEAEGELTKQLLAETKKQLIIKLEKKKIVFIRKLSDIETLLLMKNPNYRPSCQIENESSGEIDKLFKNIKAIIEYESNSSKSDSNCEQSPTENASETNSSSSLTVSEYEVHLVTQIAAFLKITPYPVSSQAIYSYVEKLDNVVDLQFVESLMKKFPSFFKEVAGEPGSMEKCWIHVDLKPVITI